MWAAPLPIGAVLGPLAAGRASDGMVETHQRISDTEGGFTGTRDGLDCFGSSVAKVGDLNGDGVNDLAVAARGDDDGGHGPGCGVDATAPVLGAGEEFGVFRGFFTQTLDIPRTSGSCNGGMRAGRVPDVGRHIQEN